MSDQKHRSSPTILESRTLEASHRRLAQILRPGMRVLDIGCGSGSITEGIARAIQPGGLAIGLDRDEVLIERARSRTKGQAGLEFRVESVLELSDEGEYDVVTAARVLQWISDVPSAIARMTAATRPGGTVLALDYDHADIVREPTPPLSTQHFYDDFLRWRESNGWDNRMGSNLPDLFERTGLLEVVSTSQDEVVHRGDPGFDDALRIWAIVMQEGHAMPPSSGHQIQEVVADYEAWCRNEAQYQCMVLHAVEGRKHDGVIH